MKLWLARIVILTVCLAAIPSGRSHGQHPNAPLPPEGRRLNSTRKLNDPPTVTERSGLENKGRLGSVGRLRLPTPQSGSGRVSRPAGQAAPLRGLSIAERSSMWSWLDAIRRPVRPAGRPLGPANGRALGRTFDRSGNRPAAGQPDRVPDDIQFPPARQAMTAHQIALQKQLAAIDRMRDEALRTGNLELLNRADQLESQARARFQR